MIKLNANIIQIGLVVGITNFSNTKCMVGANVNNYAGRGHVAMT